MTRAQAFRRMRRTTTPERVVKYVTHPEGCPARRGEGRCTCVKLAYAWAVVLDK